MLVISIAGSYSATTLPTTITCDSKCTWVISHSIVSTNTGEYMHVHFLYWCMLGPRPIYGESNGDLFVGCTVTYTHIYALSLIDCLA